MTNPKINVTPLIDVLLVLLIIFMVVSPAKPSRFEAKIPQESKNIDQISIDPQTLVVTVEADSSLKLNKQPAGSVDEPGKLNTALSNVFRQRLDITARVDAKNVQRTVFIKARSTTSYGDVAKVVDAVKASGAAPISLMIDNLD